MCHRRNTLERQETKMFNTGFGVEVEFTGITRAQARKVTA